MQIPYSEMYSRLWPTDELRDQILGAQSEQERERLLLGYLSEAVSPYEFYSFVWGSADVSDLGLRLPDLILDHIVQNKSRWYDDEVACFLLEVAEDRQWYADNPRWLIAVDLPGMLQGEYAGPMIWEMFFEGHEDLILELAEHYHWDEILAKAREPQDKR